MSYAKELEKETFYNKIKATFFPDRNFNYFEMDKSLINNFPYRYSFKIKENNMHKYLYDTKIEIPAKIKFLFLAPKGAFAVGLSSDGRLVNIFPHITNKIKNVRNANKVITTCRARKLRIYIGYYYPNRETGDPILPNEDDYCVLYLSRSTDSLKNKIAPFKNPITIERIHPCSVWANIFILLNLSLPLVVLFLGFKIIKNLKIDKPQESKSMKTLYRFGKRNFLCIYCGQKLKVKGKFKCPVGHVPIVDRYIFKGCLKCDSKYKKMKCNNCGSVIELEKKYYIREEIENRGKAFISRINPLKKYWWYVCCSACTIFSFSGALHISPYGVDYRQYLYYLIHGFGSYYIVPFDCIGTIILPVILISFVVGYLYIFLFTKEIVIKNPYNKNYKPITEEGVYDFIAEDVSCSHPPLIERYFYLYNMYNKLKNDKDSK